MSKVRHPTNKSTHLWVSMGVAPNDWLTEHFDMDDLGGRTVILEHRKSVILEHREIGHFGTQKIGHFGTQNGYFGTHHGHFRQHLTQHRLFFHYREASRVRNPPAPWNYYTYFI